MDILFWISNFYRVLTGPKEWGAISSLFIDGEPNSVWKKIYENHMSDESFASSQTAAIESLLKTDGFKTVFFTVEDMAYFSEPCELKFVWLPQKD